MKNNPTVTIHTINPKVIFTGKLMDISMSLSGHVQWVIVQTKQSEIKINTNHIVSITYARNRK